MNFHAGRVMDLSAAQPASDGELVSCGQVQLFYPDLAPLVCMLVELGESSCHCIATDAAAVYAWRMVLSPMQELHACFEFSTGLPSFETGVTVHAASDFGNGCDVMLTFSPLAPEL